MSFDILYSTLPTFSSTNVGYFDTSVVNVTNIPTNSGGGTVTIRTYSLSAGVWFVIGNITVSVLNSNSGTYDRLSLSTSSALDPSFCSGANWYSATSNSSLSITVRRVFSVTSSLTIYLVLNTNVAHNSNIGNSCIQVTRIS